MRCLENFCKVVGDTFLTEVADSRSRTLGPGKLPRRSMKCLSGKAEHFRSKYKQKKNKKKQLNDEPQRQAGVPSPWPSRPGSPHCCSASPRHGGRWAPPHPGAAYGASPLAPVGKADRLGGGGRLFLTRVQQSKTFCRLFLANLSVRKEVKATCCGVLGSSGRRSRAKGQGTLKRSSRSSQLCWLTTLVF